MQFSMNGYRRNLMRQVQDLRNQIESILEGEACDSDNLRESMNGIIQQANIINCVFKKDDPEFSDMSDQFVEFIEEVVV